MPSPTEKLARRLFVARGYESRDVPTANGKVHILTSEGDGDAPPIVCVHGFAASGIQLAPLVRFLRPAARRVTVVDLPGHGFSEIPTAGLDTELLLEGVLEALDRVIEEPSVVLGNSMGGYVALRYALRSPARVRSLVLVSPGGAAMDQASLDRMRALFHVKSHGDALRFVDALLGRPTPLRHLFAISARRRLSREDLMALLDGIRTDQLLSPAEVSALAMPTLVVWGQGDRVLPRENLEFFRAHLPPRARIVEPERVGHSPYLETPRALARMVLEFAREPA